jgi:3-mercaptopyruvate sulfurtransferase SseA
MTRNILIASFVLVGIVVSVLWARAQSQQTTEQKQADAKPQPSAKEQPTKEQQAKEQQGKQPERIEAADLKKKLDSGEKMLLIDVREDWELKADGAIPGAIHIPVGELDARMKDIPKDVQLVFY